MIFFRYLFLFFVFTFSIINLTELSARGARGGRGGLGFGNRGFGWHSGHRGPMGSNATGAFIAIFSSVFVVSYLSYLRFKNYTYLNKKRDNVGQIIYEAQTSDKFWNENKMRKHGIDYFFNFFKCYSNGDFSAIAKITDEDIINKYTSIILKNKSEGMTIEFEFFKLKFQRIVYVKDHRKNEKDEFKMYFEGIYTVIEKRNHLSHEHKTVTFNTLLTFHRKNKFWQLSKIEENLNRKTLDFL